MRERTLRRQQQRLGKVPKTLAYRRSTTVLAALVLTFGTLLLYAPVRNHNFINYDDDDYVVRNPHVTAGLTWETVRWSLSSVEQANWHPVTWLSHALDCQLFGFDAGAHHTTNLLIHACNVLLLFLLLWRATQAAGRSFLVAALFASHPFNVQSVAWVAERKSLLCMFFSLLAIGAYGWYSRQPQAKRFAVVMAFFLLALGSKPMAVTLPFVLLLLDYWPLRRIDGWSEVSSQFVVERKPVRGLVLEKWPLFSLSLLSCAITIWAQRAGGALRPLQAFSFDVRLKNAVLSYVYYLSQTFWPSGFALYYPHPGSSLSSWKALLAAIFLFLVTLILWNQRKTRAYLVAGWLWFLGTLLPVIGIMQVGDQAMADRYMYLPLLGIFVIAVWTSAELFHKYSIHRFIRFSAPALVLGMLSVLTIQQLRYWDNSVTLWSHTLQVTNGDLQVEKQLANALVREGSTDEVLPHLIKITQQDPGDITTHLNLGSYYASRGEVSAAAEQFKTAITLTDGRALTAYDRKLRSSAFLNLGFASVLSNDYPTALSCFRAANQSDAEIVDQMIENMRQSLANGSIGASIKLSLLLRAKEKDVEAFAILQDALRSDPDSTASRDLLNYLNGIRQQ